MCFGRSDAAMETEPRTYSVEFVDTRNGNRVTKQVTLEGRGNWVTDFAASGDGAMASDEARALALYGEGHPLATIQPDERNHWYSVIEVREIVRIA